MKHVRTAGLVLVAMFAMSAFATATAFAASPLRLVNAKGEEAKGETYTVKSGASKFETKGEGSIECKEDKGTGEITGANTDTSKITFTGCSAKEGIFSATCTSSGAASGDIELNANSKIVYLNKESEENVGLDLELKANVTIVCEAFGVKQTLTVKGSTLCPTTTALSKTAKITCEQSGGVQKYVKYEEKGTSFEDKTETEGKGKKTFGFTQSGLQGTDTLEYAKQELEVEK